MMKGSTIHPERTTRRPTALSRTGWIAAFALVVGAIGGAPPAAGAAAGQPDGERRALPFAPGEHLVYQVNVGRRTVGEAVMRVSGPEGIRGQRAHRLTFETRARLGPATVEDRTYSWVDPQTLATLRYHKYERNPLFSSHTKVDVFPGEGRWKDEDGSEGRTPSARPLDELSFIYHVRALPLRDGDRYECHRHYDRERAPVRTRVIGRERVTVPAGTFDVIVVEMVVDDARRFGGSGTIRLHLTDDDRRVPVRIETRMPVAGTTRLELERGA
jgi:hypothetical protein